MHWPHTVENGLQIWAMGKMRMCGSLRWYNANVDAIKDPHFTHAHAISAHLYMQPTGHKWLWVELQQIKMLNITSLCFSRNYIKE